MFTGIVEEVGRIVDVGELDGGRRFRIGCRIPLTDLEQGASIAVDGACLTVVAYRDASSGGSGIGTETDGNIGDEGASAVGDGPDDAFRPRTEIEVEAIGTTLSRTVAAEYVVGSEVNLERARALGERLEGHLVQGHVDGLATVERVRDEGVHHLVDVSLPPDVWRGTILHGSVTLNGVSLTVNDLEAPDRCQVALIPYTWTHTNLSRLAPGDAVNVEGDLIGKYVSRYLEEAGEPPRKG